MQVQVQVQELEQLRARELAAQQGLAVQAQLLDEARLPVAAHP